MGSSPSLWPFVTTHQPLSSSPRLHREPLTPHGSRSLAPLFFPDTVSIILEYAFFGSPRFFPFQCPSFANSFLMNRPTMLRLHLRGFFSVLMNHWANSMINFSFLVISQICAIRHCQTGHFYTINILLSIPFFKKFSFQGYTN